MLALEEDRVEGLRVEVGVERLAVGADLAVHRPGVDEVGLLRPVVARVDVVVLGGHHDVVRRGLRVLARQWCSSADDLAGHPGAAGRRPGEPPSQKSFWTSTTISACFMVGRLPTLLEDRSRCAGSPLESWWAAHRQLGAGADVALARGGPAARARRPRHPRPAGPGGRGRRRRWSAGLPIPSTSASAMPSGVRRRRAYLRPPTEILSLLFLATPTRSRPVRRPRGRRACRRSREVGAPLPVTSWVPTPYPSTGAAASPAIANSSRSEVTMIRVSVAPSSSSCLRTRPGERRQVAGVDAGRRRARGRRSRRPARRPRRCRRCRPAAWCPCPSECRPGPGRRRPRCRAAA